MPIALNTRENAGRIAHLVFHARKPDRASVTRLSGLDIRQQFVDQEPRVRITESVVFIAAIETIERCVAVRGVNDAGSYKNGDNNRQLFLVNEIVENGWRCETNAVLLHIKTGRRMGLVLRWHVNPIIAHGAGKNFGLIKSELEDFAFGNTNLQL